MEPITLADGKKIFLGRQRPIRQYDEGNFRYQLFADGRLKRTLHLHNYIDLPKKQAFAPIPLGTNWRAKGATGIARVFLNDQEGDCVIASKYHMLSVVSANEGTELMPTDSEVQSMYTGICGPGDNGCVITDVLDYWKATGLIVNGVAHKIDNYVAVDPSNKPLLQTALALFGSAGCIGINLPGNWTCTNCTWPTPSGGSVGGHDICVLDYDANFVYCATWGGVIQIAWSVWLAACGPVIEEMEFALVPEWYSNANLAPNGVDVATLRQDLLLLPNGTVPPIPDPNPPGPTPIPPGPTPTPPPGPVTGNSIVLTTALPAGTYSIGTAGGVYLNPATVTALRADLNQPPPVPTRTVTIPPFILVILRALCAALAVKIPFIQLLCSLIPASAMAGDSPAPYLLTWTPELVQAIKDATADAATPQGSVVSFFKAELAKMESAKQPCSGCK